MKREKAIKYLMEKGHIDGKFNKEEEKKIEEVMTKGKIYGDPIVDLNW